MPFIAILGCDGSGKSTVIKQITELLTKQKHSVLHGHWRPRIFGIYEIKADKRPVDNPHSSSARNTISSLFKLLWMAFNWWFEWFRVLRSSSNQGYVIFDRFHTDLLVDPIRYRYGGSKELAKAFCKLMPQPDLVIFLDAPVDVLLSRKNEVSEEALKHARESYLKLCAQHNNYHVLDATESIDVVVENVKDLINRHASK